MTTGSSTTPTFSGVTGVILAGGKSSRMGSNKALLPYRGYEQLARRHNR